MDYYRDIFTQIKCIKRNAVFDSFLALFVVCFPIVTIGAYLKKLSICGFFAVLALISIGIYALRYHAHQERRSKVSEPYLIPMDHFDMPKIRNALQVDEVYPNCYTSVLSENGYWIRLLLQCTEKYEKEELDKSRKKANTVINRKDSISQKISIYEAAKSVRVNLVACCEQNDDLTRWVSSDTNRMLTRVEGIVKIGIVLNQQILIIPKCEIGLDYSQVRKYETVVRLIIGRFLNA